jgi:hypothetical protein
MYIITTLALSVPKNIRILGLNSSRIYYNKEKLVLNTIFRKENTIFNIFRKNEFRLFYTKDFKKEKDLFILLLKLSR